MLITAFMQGCLDGFHMRRSEVARTMKGHRRDREQAQHNFDRLAMSVRKCIQEMTKSAEQYVSASDSRQHHIAETAKRFDRKADAAKQQGNSAEKEMGYASEDFEPDL